MASALIAVDGVAFSASDGVASPASDGVAFPASDRVAFPSLRLSVPTAAQAVMRPGNPAAPVLPGSPPMISTALSSAQQTLLPVYLITILLLFIFASGH